MFKPEDIFTISRVKAPPPHQNTNPTGGGKGQMPEEKM